MNNSQYSTRKKVNTLRRVTFSLAIIISLVLSSSAGLEATTTDNCNNKSTVTFAPATPTLVNGVPEVSENDGELSIMSNTLLSRTYNATSNTITPYFKEIATTSVDNRNSDSTSLLILDLNNSTQQGSEFTGNISFSGEDKLAILAEIQSSVGYEVKESRVKNEAAGWSGSMCCPAGKYCSVTAYYEAVFSSGSYIETLWAQSLGSTYTNTYPVTAKVYPTVLKINSKATTTN